MCDNTAADSLVALRLIPVWFVTSNIVKSFFTALHADESIINFNEGSGNVVLNFNEMDINNIDLNNINFDNNSDEDDPEKVYHDCGKIKFEKRKALKKKR